MTEKEIQNLLDMLLSNNIDSVNTALTIMKGLDPVNDILKRFITNLFIDTWPDFNSSQDDIRFTHGVWIVYYIKKEASKKKVKWSGKLSIGLGSGSDAYLEVDVWKNRNHFWVSYIPMMYSKIISSDDYISYRHVSGSQRSFPIFFLNETL